MRTRSSPRPRILPRRPRGRPKTEDLDALKARLILAARQAFVRNGYGATSINSIARSARVSKNTLYARFPSKAALFRAIVARQIASVDEELQPTSSRGEEKLEDKLRAYLNVALKESLRGDMLEINRLILAESYQFPELGEAARARFKIGIQNVAMLIEKHARRDQTDCRDPVTAAELLLCAGQGWYISIMITNQAVSDGQVTSWVDNTVNIFMASKSAW